MEFQVLDPSGRDKKADIELGRRLETMFNQIKPNGHILLQLAKIPLSFPKQDNDYDCAILMMYYAEAILRTGKCITVNTEHYRVELAKRLIDMSKKNLNESMSMQRERKVLRCDTFENGLIHSHTYYAPVLPVELATKSYIVCVFGQDLTMIDAKSYRDSVHQNWLTNHIIDASLFAFMKAEHKSAFINVLCHQSYEIFKHKTGKSHILNHVAFSEKTVIMPLT